MTSETPSPQHSPQNPTRGPGTSLAESAHGGADGPSSNLPVAPAPDGSNDHKLVEMWLFQKAKGTKENYRLVATDFLAAIKKGGAAGLPAVHLKHLAAYAEDLSARGLKPSTQAQKIATVKSLLTFAHSVGYIGRNWGKMLRLPQTKDTLSERILSERDLDRLIHAFDHNTSATGRRDAALLRLLYHTGIRVSECAALSWRDVAPRRIRGQDAATLTVFGKGGKTRHVLLPPTTYALIEELRPPGAEPDDPVFGSTRTDPRTGRPGYLHRTTIWRIVKKAADEAGVDERTSTHWLRHAHASHALDRGAAVHLVKDTLGHASLVTTTRYTHARPDDSSSLYLGG